MKGNFIHYFMFLICAVGFFGNLNFLATNFNWFNVVAGLVYLWVFLIVDYDRSNNG